MNRRRYPKSLFVAAALIVCCIISYAVGIADGKQTLYPAISDLQECNKELTSQYIEAKRELNAREDLINWAALYVKKKGAK